MYNIKAENEMWSVNCTDSGVIKVENKTDAEKSFEVNLFGNRYYYLLEEWDVMPKIYLTPDEKYIVVTYGIGYVYFISFSEINYEDDSFQQVDMCCYYNERTQVDFSNTGRYAAIRVRGDFDPQESDGKTEIFTPVYFRSVFVIDLVKLAVCFQEDYSNEQGHRNLASIAFSPNDDLFVTGALGNALKVFSLNNGKCLGKFSKLVWICDSCGIRDCPLIVFLNKDNFVYVNKESNIVRVTLQESRQFVESGIIKTNVPQDHEVSKGVYDKWSYIEKIELDQDEIICYFNGSRKEYYGERRFKLQFDEINKI